MKTAIKLPKFKDFDVSEFYDYVWDRARNEPSSDDITPIPRREWRDEISLEIARHGHKYNVYRNNGALYDYPDIDELFGTDEDDRFFSNYLQSEEIGEKPFRKVRNKERLTMIWLFLELRLRSRNHRRT